MGCRTCVTSNWAATPTADVRALPGVRYYLARAGDLSRLVAPPYDVISDSDLEHYRSLSPYNVVHLTRPGTDYQGAARTFERWLHDRILEPDARSMYVHEVEFDGRIRRDLIASLRLQGYSDRVVLPHERTHRGPKEDRLALLRATKVSIEPLRFLYEGAKPSIGAVLDRVGGRAPAVTFTGPEAHGHRLWVISHPVIHASMHAALEDLPVLI